MAKSSAEKASKERAAAAAQPLEASQRAVIRDLSLRVANLTRLNNQLKEERERAQVSVLNHSVVIMHDERQQATVRPKSPSKT